MKIHLNSKITKLNIPRSGHVLMENKESEKTLKKKLLSYWEEKKKSRAFCVQIIGLMLCTFIFLISWFFIAKSERESGDILSQLFGLNKVDVESEMLEISSSRKRKEIAKYDVSGGDPNPAQPTAEARSNAEYSTCMSNTDGNNEDYGKCVFNKQTTFPGEVIAKMASAPEIKDADVDNAFFVMWAAIGTDPAKLVWEYNKKENLYNFYTHPTEDNTKLWCCYLSTEPLFTSIFDEVSYVRSTGEKIEGFKASWKAGAKDQLEAVFAKSEITAEWRQYRNSPTYKLYYSQNPDSITDKSIDVESTRSSVKVNIEELDNNKVYYLMAATTIGNVKVSSDILRITTGKDMDISKDNAEIITPEYSDGDGDVSFLNQKFVGIDGEGSLYFAKEDVENIMKFEIMNVQNPFKYETATMFELLTGGEDADQKDASMKNAKSMLVSADGDIFLINKEKIVKIANTSYEYTVYDDESFKPVLETVIDATLGASGKIYLLTKENLVALDFSGESQNSTKTSIPEFLQSSQEIAVDSSENIYLASKYRIMKIVLGSGGGTSILAGKEDAKGHIDDKGEMARFQSIQDIAVNGKYLYVTDKYSIRRVDITTGEVTTFAGDKSKGDFNYSLGDLVVPSDGVAYVIGGKNGKYFRVVKGEGVDNPVFTERSDDDDSGDDGGDVNNGEIDLGDGLIMTSLDKVVISGWPGGKGIVKGEMQTYDFEEAKSYCKNLGDWRLANMEEIEEIFAKKREIGITFPIGDALFWTTTPIDEYPDYQMAVGAKQANSGIEFFKNPARNKEKLKNILCVKDVNTAD